MTNTVNRSLKQHVTICKLVKLIDLILFEIFMVELVDSRGITGVIQHEYDTAGTCVLRILNEFLSSHAVLCINCL